MAGLSAATSVRTPRAVPGTVPKKRPIAVWAVAGGFFVLLQLYVYVSWLLSGDFAAVDPGPDPLNAGGRFWVPFFQVASPVAAGSPSRYEKQCRSPSTARIAPPKKTARAARMSTGCTP
ncbi:MAG TPA: hypothetical protein VEG38_01795 [Acidimicrobiia bacterium]|nr:hypothetical protein [Acidimicrobiia bacterium]